MGAVSFRPGVHFGNKAAKLDANPAELKKQTEPDLKAAWQSPEIRRSFEDFLLKDKFRANQELGKKLLAEIEILAKTDITPKEFFDKLAQFHQQLPQQDVTTTDTTYRVQRADHRAKQIQSVAGTQTPTWLLDIGCGNGEITEALARTFNLPKNRTLGADVYQRTSAAPQFTYLPASGTALPFKDGTLSMITLIMVLHHVEEADKMIAEAFRVLQPGGKLVVREHDAVTPENRLFNWLADHVFYRVFHNYPDIPNPGNYLSRNDWEKKFKAAGFEVDTTLVDEPNNPFRPYTVALKKSSF